MLGALIASESFIYGVWCPNCRFLLIFLFVSTFYLYFNVHATIFFFFFTVLSIYGS